jgi:hypothetical protein
MFSRHTSVSIAKQISELVTFFQLLSNFGYAIADNASENTTCLNHLSELLNIDMSKRRIICIGHIINLVAQQVLFGSDVDAFKEELTNITTEEIELRN